MGLVERQANTGHSYLLRTGQLLLLVWSENGGRRNERIVGTEIAYFWHVLLDVSLINVAFYGGEHVRAKDANLCPLIFYNSGSTTFLEMREPLAPFLLVLRL